VGKEGRITQEERLHVISLTLTIEYINLKDSILQASKVSPPKSFFLVIIRLDSNCRGEVKTYSIPQLHQLSHPASAKPHANLPGIYGQATVLI
jgi:hypothetical protein